MSAPDNELISFDDIPVSPIENKNNSNKSVDDVNSEKDSIHSFNGSEDKDTERTSFDEEEAEEQVVEEKEAAVNREPVEILEENIKKEEAVEEEEKEEVEEDPFDDFSNNQPEQQDEVDDDDDFGDFDDENNDDDDFGDFDDEFTRPTDDFGDFNDEPIDGGGEGVVQQPIKNEVEIEDNIPKTPTPSELYYNVLKENNITNISNYIDDYLNDIMNPNNSIVSMETESNQVLSTQCSQELWDRLSRDSVFFNPVTGTVGQFQWIRSETNKSYLNALGVTLNYEEKALHNPALARTKQQKRHTSPLETTHTNKSPNNTSGPSTPNSASTVSSPSSHSRSASATLSDGLRVVVAAQQREEEKEAKREAEQEMELDIDIARAYCELTEETIRVFPDVKLNAMVIELERLQKQAADYLDTLLDQREQLLMDAETYNDLISCIVGHAQRLREQNASKDASPAMVHKKKNNSSGFGGLMRRKTGTTTNTSSVSMGGGVVGVKQNNPTATSKKTMPAVNESRRSL